MDVIQSVAHHIYWGEGNLSTMVAMKKTILLTGASGSVGFEAFIELLRRRDQFHIRILNLDRKFERNLFRDYQNQVDMIWGDISNLDDIQLAVQGVDAVLHTAAIIPPLADHNPDQAWQVNVEGTRNLVRVLKEQSHSAALIYTSSISVYGDRIENPHIRVGDPLHPSLGDEYAKTKIAAENIIQASGLNWGIFRLCGILTNRLGIQPLMFHMPLDTALEWCHAKDAGLALVNALGRDQLVQRIFNLGGGKACRVRAVDFLKTMFNLFGIDFRALPRQAFATRNFHSGYYADSDVLNRELSHQQITLQDYYAAVRQRIAPWRRTLMRSIPRAIIREYFMRMSEPLKAIRTNNVDLITRFYGSKGEFDRLASEVA